LTAQGREATRWNGDGMERSKIALVARICAGGWFEAYDLFMTSYIALGLYREGLFTPTGAGFAAFASFAASGFAGMFAGTLLFGWFSDRFGRRSSFMWSLLAYSAMTLGMSLAGSAPAIDVWRFFAGIGIGVQIITVDAYVTEIASAADRGRLVALSQAITFTAVPVVAILSAWLVPQQIGPLAGWRVVSLVGSIGALFAFTLWRGLPESQRWSESRRGSGSWDEIWSRTYRGRTALLAAFNVLQTFGYYGFTTWVTTLLFSEHVTFVHSLQYTAVIGFAYPFGPVIAMYFADRIERKWQIAALAVGIAAAGIAFGASRSPVAIILWGIAMTLAINWFSSAFHAYQAEVYPTRIRARAVGFVYSLSRVSSIFVGFGVARVLGIYGTGGVFVMIAAAMILVAAIVAVFGPRTNGLELDALSP
jgi:MFS transporter, putative metabolite:H+ symporter